MRRLLVGRNVTLIHRLKLFRHPFQLPLQCIQLSPLRGDNVVQISNGLILMRHAHFEIIDAGVGRGHMRLSWTKNRELTVHRRHGYQAF